MVKNVLCFPNHSNGVHRSGGFCGEMVKVEILTNLDYEEFPYLIVGEFSSILKNNISLKPQDLISTDELFSKNSYRRFYYGTVANKDMLDENIWRYEVHVNKELKAWNYPYKTSKNQDYNCHCFFVYVLTPVDKSKRLFQCVTRIQSPPFQIRCSRRTPSTGQEFVSQKQKNSFNIYKQSQLMKLIQQTEDILPPFDNNNNNNNSNDDEEEVEENYTLTLDNINNSNSNNVLSSPSSSPTSSSSPETVNIFDELDDISNIEAAKCPMSKYYSNFSSLLPMDDDSDSNEESPIKKCPYLAKQKQLQQLSVPSSNITVIPDTFLKSSPPPSQIHTTTTNITTTVMTKENTKTKLQTSDIKDYYGDEKRYKSCCEANYLIPLLPIIALLFIVMIIFVYIESKRSDSYTSMLGEKLMIYQLLLRQLSYHYSCYNDIIKFNRTIAMDFMSKPFENQINDLFKIDRKTLSQSCQLLLYNTISDDNCSLAQQNYAKNSNLQFYFIIGVLIIGLFLHLIHKYILMLRLRSTR